MHDHAHDHTHDHAHGHLAGAGTMSQRLILAILVSAAILAIEVVGGIVANSLALLSDAGHVLTDLAALLLSLWTLRVVSWKPTGRKTFGFVRMEILSALVNGVALVVVSLFIFVEAYRRIRTPEPVQGAEVFVIAILGLAGNGIGVLLLSGAGKNINIRGAMLHLVGDAVSSVGVILAGLVIALTGWWIVDPLMSIIIGLIIIVGAVRLIGESVDVLLEATPKDINYSDVVAQVRAVPGVQDVHDVHIWCLTPQLCTMSSHVLLETGSNHSEVLRDINKVLSTRYGIRHTTFQFEHAPCGQDDVFHMVSE